VGVTEVVLKVEGEARKRSSRRTKRRT